MRLEKGQTRGADRIRFGGHENERKRRKEEKVQAHQRHVTFVTGKVIGRITTSISKSD